MRAAALIRIAGIVFFLFLSVTAASAAPLVLYVAPSGNDAAPGTLQRPLATPQGAQARLRALAAAGKMPGEGAVVWLRGGVYPLRHPLTLTVQDGGVPVTYAAYKNEPVTLEGGQEVFGWRPVTDSAVLARLDPAARGHVLQADLKAQGITDYGELARRGFGQPVVPAALELFFGNAPMTLARWPNDGRWATIAGTAADQGPDHFSYSGDRPLRWTGADDAWVHGYWSFDWADTYEKILRIDTAHHQIDTAPTGSDGLLAYTPQHRWYVLNLLEELDAPREWYLDRHNGILYFWPPSDVAAGRPTVSLAQTLVTLDHVSHVTLRGLTLQDCRGTAVTIQGGMGDALQNCIIRNTGNDAVDIQDATKSGVRGCEISGTGDSGIEMTGGDRQTLTPGGDFVTDCHIHDYSRWDRTYHPAVGINGVGNIVSHNLIDNAPHNAILLSGNDHVIEYNEIHHVCLQTGDSGAFYMGRDWTMRGNIVRFNFFHDLGGASGLLGTTDVVGVYLDDTAAGTTIYGNLFVRVPHGVEVGGGRDDIVDNNVFVDCQPAVSLDARGLGWAAHYLLPGGGWGMQEKLAAVPWNRPPYTSRYPHLANLLQDDPAAPKYDVIAHNIAFQCPNWLAINDGDQARQGATIDNNLADADPQFVDAAHGDYRLRPTSPAFALGFRPLPLGQIGPRDEASGRQKNQQGR